ATRQLLSIYWPARLATYRISSFVPDTAPRWPKSPSFPLFLGFFKNIFDLSPFLTAASARLGSLLVGLRRLGDFLCHLKWITGFL
ncbi:MAG: hypothetical protein ACKO96_41955, partial [Flammeovirgaceae bacterium]